MNKNQINNILRFTFLFSIALDALEASPDYLLEKWNNHIGAQPYKNIKIKKKFKNTYDNLIKVYYEKWGDYKLEGINEILYMIVVILDKRVYDSPPNKLWLPSNLIDNFKHVVDVENINKSQFRLHEKVEIAIENYKNIKHIKRDIILFDILEN